MRIKFLKKSIVLLITVLLIMQVPIICSATIIGYREGEIQQIGDFIIGDHLWENADTGNYIIRYLVEYTGNDKDVIIPQDLNIKCIDSGAFKNGENIENIAIPEGVTTMFDNFSDCPNLKSVTFPKNFSGFPNLIPSSPISSSPDLVLYVYADSPVMQQAINNGWNYQVIEEADISDAINILRYIAEGEAFQPYTETSETTSLLTDKKLAKYKVNNDFTISSVIMLLQDIVK